MPTFTTKIYLQKAERKDVLLLTNALKQRSFIEHYSSSQQKTNTNTTATDLTFTRQGNHLLEINDEILRAVQQTGYPFSFTVAKNKN